MHKRHMGILAFLLALAIGAKGRATQCKAFPCKQNEEINSQQQNTEKFKGIRIGEERGPDGGRLGFRTFEGSAGSIVVVTYGTRESSDRAIAVLRLWLRTAKEIMQDEPKKDRSGQVMGQRAVATFVGEQDKEYTAVLWTNGSDCIRIQAPSLAVAIRFEERINSDLDLVEE